MATTLTPEALPDIASALSAQGLDLLAGALRGDPRQAADLAATVAEHTGLDLADAAGAKLTDEQWTQLKAFEQERQGELRTLGQVREASLLERERVAATDRADARTLQKTALENEDPVARQFIYWYAAGLTLLTFSFIFWAAFGVGVRTEAQQRTIDTVLGFLLGVSLSAIIQYFFGSSLGSKIKDDKIAQMRRHLGEARGGRRG